VKEEKRKSGNAKTGPKVPEAVAVATGGTAAAVTKPETAASTTDADYIVSPVTDEEAGTASSPTIDPNSPHSERLAIDPEIANAITSDKEVSPMSDTNAKDSKMRNWIKAKLRRSSRGANSKPVVSPTNTGEAAKDKGFVGGAAYTGASANNSTTSLPTQESVRSVALAGTGVGVDEGGMPTGVNGKGKERAVSISSSEGEYEEARDRFDEDLAPPRTFEEDVKKSSSPIRETKFHEVI